MEERQGRGEVRRWLSADVMALCQEQIREQKGDDGGKFRIHLVDLSVWADAFNCELQRVLQEGAGEVTQHF